MTTVTVLLNRQEDEKGRPAIFTRFPSESAYQPGDELEAVLTLCVEADSALRALDRTFEMCNRGAPGFLGDAAYPQRSLSVGDVVEVNGVRYACEIVGWRKLF